LTKNEINVILDNLCRLGIHHKIHFLWRPYLPDPKDDHVLELAVASNVSKIVTHNIKDFKKIERFNKQAITPKQFLEEMK